MANRIDNGYCVIVDNDDGSQSILITADPENGNPTSVYARYIGSPGVDILDDVTLAGSPGRYWTAEAVQVFSDEAGLHIVPVPTLNAAALQSIGTNG